MLQKLGCSLAVVLCTVAVARATPTVVVGNFYPAPNTTSFSIPISVTGGDAVNGIVFIAEISQTGQFPATGSPSFVSIDMTTGTIFSGNQMTPAVSFATRASSTTVTTIGSAGGPSYTPLSGPAIKVKESFLTQSGTVSANGLLATLVISTVGAPLGVYDLKLTGEVTGGGGGANSSFTFVAGGTSSFTNGLIGGPVPEPSSIVLGLFALAGLSAVAIRNKRARRLARR